MKIPPAVSSFITTYTRYISIGVAILVLVLGYILVLSPKLTEIRSSDVIAQQKAESELAVQQKYVAALRTSNDKFSATLPSTSLAAIDNFVPSDQDFPGLMLTVKHIVEQAQLTMDSFTVGQSSSVAASSTVTSGSSLGAPTASAATIGGVALQTQDVSLTVSGGTSYDAFKQLLTLFESSQRLFDIQNVSFSLGKDTQGGSWTLQLRTYFYPNATKS